MFSLENPEVGIHYRRFLWWMVVGFKVEAVCCCGTGYQFSWRRNPGRCSLIARWCCVCGHRAFNARRQGCSLQPNTGRTPVSILCPGAVARLALSFLHPAAADAATIYLRNATLPLNAEHCDDILASPMGEQLVLEKKKCTDAEHRTQPNAEVLTQ